MKKNTILLALSFTALLSSLHSSVLAQQSIVPIDSAIRRSFDAISSDPRVSAGLLRIEAREAEMVREQFRLTEIPAPPFKEEVRAAYYLTLMQDRGLEDAYIDSEGNAIGIRLGSGDGPTLLIAAHLDTVFPEGVDTSIELRRGRYYAPGIGDDTRGLAAMLSIIETLNDSGIQTHGDIIFAANVGEEGRGDLRGIKAIFRDHPRDRWLRLHRWRSTSAHHHGRHGQPALRIPVLAGPADTPSAPLA